MQTKIRYLSTYLLLILVVLPNLALGQESPRISGRVASAEGPIVGAHVTVQGTVVRTISDIDGAYELPSLSPGRYVILARAVGYEMSVDTVLVEAADVSDVDFQLSRVVVQMEPITVTGTMKEAFLSESPVTVKVIPVERLQRVTTANLLESLEQVNGLYQQVDCAVCGTNNMRINGLEGANTAFLIDGMPIMGALASVYGLNGINPAIVEQVEILKGPSSTLYGSEALAGVINVITKDPRFAPRYSLNVFGTSHRETNADFALASGTDRTHALVSGSVSYVDHFMDNVADGFADIPSGGRASLFGKLDYYGRTQKRFGLAAKVYYEDRLGGTELFDRSLRGSSTVYGESIFTNRFELTGMYRLPFATENIQAQFSYAYHDQDSYYGETRYDAVQHIGYLNLVWSDQIGSHNDLLVGGTLRYDSYDDNTPATLFADNRFIPGIFAQNELKVTDDFNLLGGVRFDHHKNHGVIFSPRAAVKWNASNNTTFRLNAGTGFRVIHLFTEDHAAYSGLRELIVENELRPERTKNITFNLNQALRIGANPMLVDLDLFYTHFNNRILTDYDRDPNEIHYYNVDGHSVSRGVSLSLNQVFEHLPLTYALGITYQDVYHIDGGFREEEFYSASWLGTWSASYDFGDKLLVDFTGSLTGPMRLPEYAAPFERATQSPWYSVHNVQATFSIKSGFDVYGGIKNIFDYTQVSPLINPTDPFGDSFDTAYVYGPMQGRRFMVGLRMTGGR